jgi:asparagine synthase (glutamine-hydrolysing)
MGQFLIAPVAMGDTIDGILAGMAAQGFQCGLDISTGDYRVVVHRRLNGSSVNMIDLGGGGFALHTGSLIFDGMVGEAALNALHAAFDPANPPWSRCRGHYAVILRKDKTLYLMTDRLGSYHIYHRRDAPVFSSSFLAVLDSIEKPAPDATGIYQYVWNGSTFGDRTVFDDVRLLAAPSVITFGGSGARIDVKGAAIDLFAEPGHGTLDEAAEEQAGKLRRVFSDYAALAPRPFRSALSGGYDSRLILAGLRAAGIDPDLFVFGKDTDADVVCAKAIAAGEGIALRHLDKSTVPTAEPDAFPEQVRRDLYAFDALKYGGLFDSGADHTDRIERQRGDAVVLNGSVGEIFRNFFYLPDRPARLEDVVSAFYSRFDPGAMTGAFSEAAYRDALVTDMAHALRIDRLKVSRAMIEALYPLFRGRFWSSRDLSINQRFGWMLYPYLEPSVIEGTNNLPLAMKDFGRLEAAIIRRLSPKLAGYPSSYGFALDHEPPLSYRLSMLSSIHRPLWLRRRTYRLARHPAPPAWLTPPWLRGVLDMEMPYMRGLFHMDRLKDPEALNRALTVELLCQRAGAGHLVNS